MSSHGIGLNASTELGWYGRIVACGLEGKGTTSLEREGVSAGVEEVGEVFVREMSDGLSGVDMVTRVDEQKPG